MIEETFLKLKSNLELTQTFQDTISRQYNAVSGVIQNNHADVRKVRLIGSVGRKTRIQPPPGSNADFDIDMLVVLGQFDYWAEPGKGTTKEKAMDSVQEAVKQAERYAKKNPERDNPTVTFTYENGVKVELVPAYVDNIGKKSNGAEHTPKGRAYWVPSRTDWQLADYEYEAEEISKANAACNGMLIPIVKMLKAAKREHFPSMKSTSGAATAWARIQLRTVADASARAVDWISGHLAAVRALAPFSYSRRHPRKIGAQTPSLPIRSSLSPV